MDARNAVLITGSKGLIGRQLVKQLTEKGKLIIELDNRFPLAHKNHGDIRDAALLKKLIPYCRGIIHLAAVSRVIWGEQNPSLCWDTNVEGTHHVLKAAFESAHRPWIIFASSREVYGQQTSLPVTEAAALLPLNHYARSKVAAEDLINTYRDQGLRTAILRFSSVYGSMHDYIDRVIPAFCLAALHDKSLRIEGFQHVLDFTHVHDTVQGIMAVAHQLDRGVNDLPPMHLTTEHATSLLDVALLLKKILRKPINVEEAPARTYDVHQFYGSPALANDVLGWKATITLAEGLTDLLTQYQTQSSLAAIP